MAKKDLEDWKKHAEERKSKVSSVFLGEQAEDLAFLKTFYPQFTIAGILRSTIEQISLDNSIIMKPDAEYCKSIAEAGAKTDRYSLLQLRVQNITDYIEEINDYLWKIEDSGHRSLVIPRPSTFYEDPVAHRTLALTFCELLLCNSPEFRERFISTCHSHNLDWNVVLSIVPVNPDTDAMKKKRERPSYDPKYPKSTMFETFFIDNERFLGTFKESLECIDPVTLGDPLTSELTFSEILKQQNSTECNCELYHDHDLTVKILLLETCHKWISHQESKVMMKKSTWNTVTKEFLDQLINHAEEHDSINNPKLIIDFSGTVSRKGRTFFPPIDIVSEEDASHFLQKSLVKKEVTSYENRTVPESSLGDQNFV